MHNNKQLTSTYELCRVLKSSNLKCDKNGYVLHQDNSIILKMHCHSLLTISLWITYGKE